MVSAIPPSTAQVIPSGTMPTAAIRGALSFPDFQRPSLEPHLPPLDLSIHSSPYPFVTLTFATSLDSALSLSPGTQTALSGPLSKSMTHYLRSCHAAILIGVSTAIADNPSLNCRLSGVGGYGSSGLTSQPRPIIIDPHCRWSFTSENKIFQLVREGRGRAPIIITSSAAPQDKKELLESLGGKFIMLSPRPETTLISRVRLDWRDILSTLKNEGLESIMIEGGASVINSLLAPQYSSLINSVIVTIAPTWLGEGGVVVSPPRRVDSEEKAVPAVRLEGVKWIPLGEDVVLCGRIKG
jgi:2,5-diamino-6-(ribosylamino)-4(3H)-pyrimidinone 5'-phosphate reductase